MWCSVHLNVVSIHGIIMSFIDLVPKSGAGVDSSSEESPAASPALLPKSRGTSKTIFCVNIHVEFASRLILHVNRTWCEFCWEEEPEEWMQISRCVSVHVV